jgi:hypothetical protein
VSLFLVTDASPSCLIELATHAMQTHTHTLFSASLTAIQSVSQCTSPPTLLPTHPPSHRYARLIFLVAALPFMQSDPVTAMVSATASLHFAA